jgi:hypothetical protein
MHHLALCAVTLQGGANEGGIIEERNSATARTINESYAAEEHQT